jgi:NAD-dependent deacetylase
MVAVELARIRAWIEGAGHVVALTGAGISTESGIPDFRGPEGVWTRNPEAEKLATLQHYMASPDVRRQAWRKRLESSLPERRPNAGHLALVELERRGKLHVLVTQNIDRLHQRAGSSPDIVVEVHGNALEVVCMSCSERAPMERALARVRGGEADPPCRSCGGVLKSATISFGQSLVPADIERAIDAAMHCDLLLAIGTTLAVYPVAGMVPAAKQSGARVIIVNGDPTEMDGLADAVVRGQIGEILPRIAAPCGDPSRPLET